MKRWNGGLVVGIVGLHQRSGSEVGLALLSLHEQSDARILGARRHTALLTQWNERWGLRLVDQALVMARALALGGMCVLLLFAEP